MSNTFSTENHKNSTELTTLNNAEINVPYKIAECSLNGTVRNRLAELGLTVGACVSVIKKAPLGDPLEITLRGYSLCIRAKEAKYFTLVRIDNE